MLLLKPLPLLIINSEKQRLWERNWFEIRNWYSYSISYSYSYLSSLTPPATRARFLLKSPSRGTLVSQQPLVLCWKLVSKYILAISLRNYLASLHVSLTWNGFTSTAQISSTEEDRSNDFHFMEKSHLFDSEWTSLAKTKTIRLGRGKENEIMLIFG